MVEHGPCFLVAGGRRTGRTTTLLTMGLFASKIGWDVLGVTMRPGSLNQLGGLPGVSLIDGAKAEREEMEGLFQQLTDKDKPSLILVDDVERVPDGWLADLIIKQIDVWRDSGSAIAAAGLSSELGGYRGLYTTLKKAGSGVLLAPQTMGDAEFFKTSLPRSAYGQSYPPGGGYLIRGGQATRTQVVLPDRGEG